MDDVDRFRQCFSNRVSLGRTELSQRLAVAQYPSRVQRIEAYSSLIMSVVVPLFFLITCLLEAVHTDLWRERACQVVAGCAQKRVEEFLLVCWIGVMESGFNTRYSVSYMPMVTFRSVFVDARVKSNTLFTYPDTDLSM
jgi:hypothetical protein